MRLRLYRRELRTTIRNNAAAYGYSVLATTSFAMLQALTGTPGIGEIFLFVAGASGSFALLEMFASRFFRKQLRGEPTEVVALGSSFNMFSIGVGLAVAALVASSYAAGSPGCSGRCWRRAPTCCCRASR